MEIKDELYGEHEFPDYFLEIINTDTLQRLKGIHQNGADFLRDPRLSTTRFEHSIGVMMLTKILGGTIEAQLSALLHDVSHTVFSHTIDIVENNGKQDYHEQIRQSFLEGSDLIEILKKHDVNLDYVLNEENFGIVEQNIPDLCADRLDYFFRDLNRVELLTKEEITRTIKGLVVVEDNIICKDIETAEFLSTKFLKMNLAIYFNPELEIVNIQLSSFIKKMLDSGIISREDFLTVDEEIIEKIRDSEFNEQFENILHTPVKIVESGDYFRKRKLRFVDPIVLTTNKRLSEDSQKFRDALSEFKKTPTIVYYDI